MDEHNANYRMHFGDSANIRRPASWGKDTVQAFAFSVPEILSLIVDKGISVSKRNQRGRSKSIKLYGATCAVPADIKYSARLIGLGTVSN
jgi:hypothetical protein